MRRLYTESNFILELVFAQEQSTHCEALLEAAENGSTELVVPSFCLGEPLETLGRRHRDRRALQERLQQEFTQLRRVSQYDQSLSDIDLAVSLFARSAREDVERLERFYLRLVDAAVLAPLTAEVTRRSFELRRDFDLTTQDAFVLASVVVHLDETPSEAAFATKNTKDFDDPGVWEYLEERDCRLLTSFGEAVGFAIHGS